MKTKKMKQWVVKQIRRGATADIQKSYETHERAEARTPEEFMALATGKAVDRAELYHPKNGWGKHVVTVCLN
jgi:hypothetical protein